MASNVPATNAEQSALAPTAQHGLDRRAVERVLARAAELQGLGGTESDADAISEAQLLDIAREAGLAVTSVRQAMAEERTRIGNDSEDDARWLVRVAGPTTVSASRTILGEPEAMIAYLDSYMQREECMQVQRRFTDRVTWEARNDWVAAIKRGLRSGGRSYQLSRAGHVAATVVPVDENRSLVRLDADLGPSRTNVVRVGGAVTATGVVAGGTIVSVAAITHVALALALGVAAFPVAAAGAGAYMVLRRHHGFADRISLALEQVLDRLEYGESRRPSNFFEALAIRPLLR
ncbi:MAG: hypothetical protein M3Z30_07025 [Gemmatimonadota bacterium]|nr:hypothetical protein [Gemmatimonadota bacterium]